MYNLFERDLIRDRVRAGLDRARAEGTRLGRPTVPPIAIEEIRKMRGAGMSVRQVAKKIGLSVGAVWKYTSSS